MPTIEVIVSMASLGLMPLPYLTSPAELNTNVCFNAQGWCRCPAGTAMTGIYKTDCESIVCIDRYRCAQPQQTSGLANCQQVNIDATFNAAGWGLCPTNTYMTGLYRAACDSINCIDQIECCEWVSTSGPIVASAPADNSWLLCLDDLNIWCNATTNTFLVGLERADCTGVRCIEGIREVQPMMTTPAPSTDAPPTPFPDTDAPPTALPTAAPATPFPDTDAPPTAQPTAAPATPFPDTDAPATAQPTVAPATPFPDTDAPATAQPTDAPVTPFPDTDAPPTAQPTVAPATPFPDTDAPPTAQPTDAPVTPFPDTDAPPTAQPTVAPATPFPDTGAPPTVAPATPFPDTDAPATAQPTVAPATPFPDTDAPPTAQPTDAPVTPFPDTDAPPTAQPTVAPATPFPDTDAPPTAQPTVAPATPFPDTNAPPTYAPLTPFPDTSVPTTPSPDTASPPTTEPQSSAPVTTAPETPAPELEKAEDIEVAGTVTAGVAALGAASSAGSATRLVLVQANCPKNGGQRKFPFPLHPTQMVVMGSEAAGAVLGNVLVVAAFTCFWTGGMYMATKVFPKLFDGLDTLGWLRLPTAPLFVIQWLYQGTTLGGMILVAYPASVGAWLLGAAILIACAAVPILVFRTMVRDVPLKGRYVEDPEDKGVTYAFLFGRGEWVSCSQDLHWVNRYASVTRTWRQEAAWFTVLEFASSFTLAAIGTLNTETYSGCGHVKVCMAIVFLVMCGVEAALWPHAKHRDCMFDFISLGVQSAGLLMMAAGFYSEKSFGDHSTFSTAQNLFFAAVILMLVKAGLDAFSELFVVLTGRRKRLQELQWELQKKSVATPLMSHDTAAPSNLSFSPAVGHLQMNTSTSQTTPFLLSSSSASRVPKAAKHYQLAEKEMHSRKADIFKL
eukprot:TRINITY_DN5617_c0_g2_i1.p1 TRINITY_DN5617_c0_g2~~TRINITY_DN5617_c0_g2_i1.p1  ORF type:complete len:899 (+),score=120.09 TRINITY_DN5617_c0_g2_i1:89-2785(+)